MENQADSFKKKVPVVRYNKELDKYDNVVLFPHKVAKAKEAFEKFGLPDLSKMNKESVNEQSE